MLKESNLKFTTSLIYLSIALFVFIIVRDQSGFGTAAQKEFRLSAANFQEYQNKLKTELGITTTEVSGVDIYNGKCIACHQFDSKLVGPPYNEVLPKYEGKKEELIDFILNPVKVNPEYPSMPNQGLKPNEAEAVAEYLIKTYEERQGGGSSKSESDTTSN
jgi:cytochrome c